MAYAEEADLNLDEDLLIELTDNKLHTGVKDETLMAGLLQEAERIVNSYLTGVANVPFTGQPPPVIRLVTTWIWKYRIYTHRDKMEAPKSVAEDYKMAMEMLKGIVEGDISLGLTETKYTGVPEVECSPARGWTPRDLVQ